MPSPRHIEFTHLEAGTCNPWSETVFLAYALRYIFFFLREGNFSKRERAPRCTSYALTADARRSAVLGGKRAAQVRCAGMRDSLLPSAISRIAELSLQQQ